MRAPRIHCPSCGRPVALVPTRRSGYGVVHDHKTDRRSLVLCPGSMRQMPLSEADAWQDTLPDLDDDQTPPARLF